MNVMTSFVVRGERFDISAEALERCGSESRC